MTNVQLELLMMENGARESVTARGFINMLLEEHTMENGTKTKSMAEDFTNTQMEVHMVENGWTTNITVLGFVKMPMVTSIKDRPHGQLNELFWSRLITRPEILIDFPDT